MMEKFKRRFSLRKKKEHTPESSKPHQWQEDEKKVRDATCSFQVRYLGCVEVFESRGIQICEEAVKALKSRQNRSVWSRMSIRKKKQKDQQCKGKYQRAILYVSGDALRVVDEISKGLIVDQTIEKVSFCAPDRNHEKGFAYICRDGTTRRWMCHGFLAVKESGERLSHAVGCAFAICLEKKQKRDKEAVSVTYNDKGTSFTRMGSFRHATLTERMQDPQSVIIADPVDSTSTGTDVGDSDSVNRKPDFGRGGAENPVAMAAVGAVERPRASEDMLQRQASFRGFSKLSDNSPFKRQLSLRLNELPSNLARQEQLKSMGHSFPATNGRVDVIEEVSPSKEQEHISELCEQIQGLSAALDNNIPAHHTPPPQQHNNTTALHNASTTANSHASTGASSNIPGVQPIRQTNPWDTPPAFRHNNTSSPAPSNSTSNSAAESWLQSTVQQQKSAAVGATNGAPASATPTPPLSGQKIINNTTTAGVITPSKQSSGPAVVQVHTPPSPVMAAATPIASQSHQHIRQQGYGTARSQTVDSTDVHWYSNQKAPTLRELQQRNQLVNFHSQTAEPAPNIGKQPNGGPTNPWSPALGPTSTDPFDAAWATKSPNAPKNSATNTSNPFQAGDTVTQTFKMQL